MDEIEIEKEPKDCYSYVGKFSMEKIMYLLYRKSHIDKKLSKKKKNGEINYDLLQEENSDLSFLQNGIGLENIFSDNYESKHESELNIQNVTSLMYFFMLSAAFSGYLFGVEPFDQPGVEVYKSEVRESLK